MWRLQQNVAVRLRHNKRKRVRTPEYVEPVPEKVLEFAAKVNAAVVRYGTAGAVRMLTEELDEPVVFVPSTEEESDDVSVGVINDPEAEFRRRDEEFRATHRQQLGAVSTTSRVIATLTGGDLSYIPSIDDVFDTIPVSGSMVPSMTLLEAAHDRLADIVDGHNKDADREVQQTPWKDTRWDQLRSKVQRVQSQINSTAMLESDLKTFIETLEWSRQYSPYLSFQLVGSKCKSYEVVSDGINSGPVDRPPTRYLYTSETVLDLLFSGGSIRGQNLKSVYAALKEDATDELIRVQFLLQDHNGQMAAAVRELAWYEVQHNPVDVDDYPPVPGLVETVYEAAGIRRA
jgi:hypothetical protein